MEVKIVIDGEEVVLKKDEAFKSGTYLKFGEPEPYTSQGLGKSGLVVVVYIRPGWKPSMATKEGKT